MSLNTIYTELNENLLTLQDINDTMQENLRLLSDSIEEQKQLLNYLLCLLDEV